MVQVRHAMAALAEVEQIQLLAVSGLYRTAPMGPVAQPDFVNAAVTLRTSLDPWHLLRALLAIEMAQGRVRAERWGPRRIDLDLIAYERWSIACEGLILPHPGIAERAFVVVPLLDLLPGEFQFPGLPPLQTLRDALGPIDLPCLATPAEVMQWQQNPP